MTSSNGNIISWACKLNLSSSCNVTVERRPAAPTPTIAERKRSGSFVLEQSSISPSPVITRAATI